MNDQLICPQCKNRMHWVEFDADKLLLAAVEGDEVVIARCPKCGHEVSLTPVSPDDLKGK